MIPYDIRNGVWVAFEGDTDYARNCFTEYKVMTDTSGRYSVNYKRWHLIGLELGISVAAVGVRGEPTGVAREFRADVAAVAKRALAEGRDAGWRGGLIPSRVACAPRNCRCARVICRWVWPRMCVC